MDLMTYPPTSDEDRQAVMLTPMAQPDALRPQTLGQALEWARILCEASIVPEAYRGKPADTLVAILFGRELGLSVVQSLQNVAVVKGRATVWGDAPLGIVRSKAGDRLELFREGWDAATKTAWCEVQRRGEDIIRREFSLAEAQAAGLAGKDVWKNYPRRMCKFKARNEALRDAFPDILLGIASREDADEWTASGAIEAEVTAVNGAPVATTDQLLDELPAETREAVLKGFDHLALSAAERRVKLREYRGKAEALLAHLREEATLLASRGARRVPRRKDETATTAPSGPVTGSTIPVATAVPSTPTTPEAAAPEAAPVVTTPSGDRVDTQTGEIVPDLVLIF